MRALYCLCAGLLAVASVHAQYRYAPPTPAIPSIGEAPAYLKYMGARCAALHDSIRTGPARGLSYETQSRARKDYLNDCREDEQEAQQALLRDQQDKKTQQRNEKQAQNQVQERVRMQGEQCGEAKRILKLKKARTDLSEGEKADLRRFEENYIARCS
jgi:hypothetical protein